MQVHCVLNFNALDLAVTVDFSILNAFQQLHCESSLMIQQHVYSLQYSCKGKAGESFNNAGFVLLWLVSGASTANSRITAFEKSVSISSNKASCTHCCESRTHSKDKSCRTCHWLYTDIISNKIWHTSSY